MTKLFKVFVNHFLICHLPRSGGDIDSEGYRRLDDEGPEIDTPSPSQKESEESTENIERRRRIKEKKIMFFIPLGIV